MFEDFDNPELYDTPTTEELNELLESIMDGAMQDMIELQKEIQANNRVVYESLFDDLDVVFETEGEQEEKKPRIDPNSRLGRGVTKVTDLAKKAKAKIDEIKRVVVEFVNKIINYIKMGFKPMDKFLYNRQYELNEKMTKEPNFEFKMHDWRPDDGDRLVLDLMDGLAKIVKFDYINRMQGVGGSDDVKLSYPKSCGYNNAMDMYEDVKKKYLPSKEKKDKIVKIQNVIALLKNRDKFLQSVKAQGEAVKRLCGQADAILMSYLKQNTKNGELNTMFVNNFYTLTLFIQKSMSEALHIIDIRKNIYFAMYREYGACLRAYLPGKTPELDQKTRAVTVREGFYDELVDEMD